MEDLTPNSHLRVNTPVQLLMFQFPFTKGKLNIREAFTFSFQQIQSETSSPSEQLKADYLIDLIMFMYLLWLQLIPKLSIED